jgi:hypothetical protein
MKIRLNKLEFDVTPVSSAERAAMLADPIIVQGVWRQLWQWDHVAQEGKPLSQLTPQKGAPLPNGISFFVPRKDASGAITQAEGPSKKMSEKFMKAVGAKSVSDLLQALQNILMVSQQHIPFDTFAPLNPVASYVIRMYTEFNVVQLRETSRNLSATVFVPGAVAFHHQVTAKVEDGSFEALMASKPELENVQPGYIIRPQSKANQNLRMIALARRIQEMEPLVRSATEGGKAIEDPVLRGAFGRAITEWKAIAPKANTQVAPTNA